MTKVDSLNEWNERQMVKDESEIKEEELWSLDATLTDYILPHIRAFRKMERHGWPADPGYSDKERDEAEADPKKWEAYEARNVAKWEDDLRCIELAFSLMSKSESFERSHQANKDIKIGLELFAKHYEHLWD
jgi:hypothetical protein